METTTTSHGGRRVSGSAQLHIRVPQPDAELLRQLAAQRDQTLSAVIRFLLRTYIRRTGDEGAGPGPPMTVK